MTTLILSEIMIEAIIFDFGDVFIDLKKEAIDTEFRKLGLTAWHDDLDVLNKIKIDLNTGKITNYFVDTATKEDKNKKYYFYKKICFLV